MDLAQELILESAQEYQDDDFFRYAGCVRSNLSSDPANLLSNGATTNAAKIGRPTGRSRMPSYQSGTMPLTKVKLSCEAQEYVGKLNFIENSKVKWLTLTIYSFEFVISI